MTDVAQWLSTLGLARYVSVFVENDIDEEVLPELTDADLEKLGVTLGHRKKLRKAIARLRAEGSPPEATVMPVGRARTTERSEPERRQLTVMFCDLVGSTQLSQILDPEDLRDINRAYQDACKLAIERYDGFISRYMGDGVLAFFGYPQAHEDDAERAVLAGLAVVNAMSELNEGVGKDKNVQLAVRAGIASGPVVVGDVIGEGASEERAAVGETPNLAARLQGLAKPDTVVIADSTRRLLTQTFDFQELGARHLRGFADEQTVWQVLRPASTEGRFEAQHAASLTPLVGRRDEIEVLLRRWRLAKEGKGQVVLVDGEPGVGKSRIVRALRVHIAKEPHTNLFYQCSPYHTSSPFYPVIRQLERAASLEENESANGRLDKLQALLAKGGGEPAEVVPLFAALLSISCSHRFESPDETPEQRKERTLQEMVRQLEGLSAQQPVLVVFEDVHWIDPTTLDLLHRLVERVADLDVLLIITFRPEFESPWPRHSHLTVVSLSRLVDQDCLAMVEDITRDHPISRVLAERIVRKADGIPLFVEELTKTVLEAGSKPGRCESGTLHDTLASLAIPSTLQTSLMARLDRLETAKWVAQIGGAIGREFSHELLAEVANRPQQELEAALESLMNSGLAFRHGVAPKATYTFKHALVQDVAYESLLHSKRPALHLRIANAMKRRQPDGHVTLPELLAHHYAKAGRIDDAVRYWRLAGERAIERSANLEALNHLSNALAHLPELPDTPARKEQELSLLVTLGPVEIAIKGSGCAEAEEAYARAVALCDELPDSPLHFAAYWGQWRTSRSYTTKRERADRLLPLAENLGDSGLRLQAHHCQWASLFNLGFHKRCCEHVARGLELYASGDFHSHASLYGGHDPAVCGHGEAALSLWLLGYPEKAVEQIEKALAVPNTRLHTGSKAHAMDIALMLHHFRQDPAEVRLRAEEMIAFSEEEEFAALRAKGEIFRGWALARMGKLEQGLNHMRDGIDVLHTIGTNEDLPVFLNMLAEGYGLVGETTQGLEALEAAFGEADRAALRYWIAELLRRKGELLFEVGNEEALAEECFAESLRLARAQEARSLELRAATSFARALERRGEGAAALELLSPIYDWFTEGLDTLDLVQARAQLDSLEARRRRA